MKIKFFKVLFAFMIIACQSNIKELPILSYKVNEKGVNVNYSITYDGFSNQIGRPFTTCAIKGKVFIANFFFTRCPSICPPMRNELIAIAEIFENETNFLIISHTIDPENDSVEVLKNYADATQIPKSTWQFVTSSQENILAQAQQYMTNFKPNNDATDFYHSSYVALVDKNQQIRGFYNVLVDEEVFRLQDDIDSLLN